LKQKYWKKSSRRRKKFLRINAKNNWRLKTISWSMYCFVLAVIKNDEI